MIAHLLSSSLLIDDVQSSRCSFVWRLHIPQRHWGKYFKIGCFIFHLESFTQSRSRSASLNCVRVARWKVEHLTEGEVFCEVPRHSWPSRLGAFCFISLLSWSRCRSATIDCESYEMEGKAPMLVQVCEVLLLHLLRWQQSSVGRSTSRSGALHSIFDLLGSRSSSASLDCEGSKMEGRAPY
jgi:hypothetical protein